jgi:hypothetical protein
MRLLSHEIVDLADPLHPACYRDNAGVRLLFGDHAMFFRRADFLAVGGCDPTCWSVETSGGIDPVTVSAAAQVPGPALGLAARGSAASSDPIPEPGSLGLRSRC